MSTPCCSYATPSPRNKAYSQGDSSPDDMQNRIDRLEGLVLSLMHNTTSSDPGAARTAASASRSVTDSSSPAKVGRDGAAITDGDSDVDDSLAASLGVLKVDADEGKSMYIGQEHWHLILADISEVKNYFASHKKEIETSYERVRLSKPVTAREGPTLLLGAIPTSELELRADLPSKSCVTVLCDRYFGSMDNAVSIIHAPTFRQQLRSHWGDPSKTPLMWLGLLYSILCLAMLSYHKVGDEPAHWKGKTLEMAAEFRLRTVQCLIKADYTKPRGYTVETMILYVFGEYSSRWDADVRLWLIVSYITRIAFRMGYHRDAKWFPSLSPFQAEMRRRTWALVCMADVFFSHQMSLPSMINDHDCDTQLPNNLFDEDIYPDIQELPPSRPNTQATPVSYMIAKVRLSIELGNILQAINQVGKHVSYDEIIRFDAKLRQVMQEMPSHLKLGTLEEWRDPVSLLIARFNLDLLYQKIMCLLHRKYLPKAQQNPRYAHPRRSAIEASLQAMTHLQMLHRESQSSGKFRAIDWFVKSVATKEFILPAMLIVLDLHFDDATRQSGGPTQDHDGAFLWTREERSKMLGALDDAANIWKCLADTSIEAFKPSKVLEIMLQKIRNPLWGDVVDTQADTSTSETSIGSTITGITDNSDFLEGLGDETNSFANTNTSAFMGMELSLPPSIIGDMQTEGFDIPGGPSPLSIFTNLGGISGEAADPMAGFDWITFESYTQMANWSADQSFQIFGAADAQSDLEPNSMSV